jgi:hypothetical protein
MRVFHFLQNKAIAALLTAVALLWTPDLSGQAFTSSLTGVVTDPNGAVIPDTAISIKNLSTNEVRSTTTGPEGRYSFSQLLPGDYDVTAEMRGFRKFLQKSLTLRASQAGEFNIPLQIGDITQTVEVEATTIALETQSATQSVTFTANQVTNLPISVRTPMALLMAVAGTTSVSSSGGSVFNDVFDQQYSRFALNGGRDNTTLILLDGAPATGRRLGRTDGVTLRRFGSGSADQPQHV